VQLLRARRPWFDELNKCRNVLHHQGWRGDVAAYFPPDADEPEARNPSRNILLVPDLESLKNNSRSLNWTYKNATHLEGVVRRALDGLREFLDAVCLGVWDGKTPKPRTDPSAAQPNAMITYPRPVPLHDSSTMHLPVFSTEELARSFTGYPNGIPATVVSVPLLNVLFPEPAFAISLAGFESEVAKGVRVTIVVDPVDGTLKQRRLSPSVPEQLLSSPPFLDPLGLLQSVMQANRLFCWQQTP
jgi:hypothetical protein